MYGAHRSCISRFSAGVGGTTSLNLYCGMTGIRLKVYAPSFEVVSAISMIWSSLTPGTQTVLILTIMLCLTASSIPLSWFSIMIFAASTPVYRFPW